MSKDFACNGLRLGIIVSRNKSIIDAISTITIFAWPSASADVFWSTILEDHEFLTYYLSENQRRLGEAYEFLTGLLDKLGINYVRGGNAGFFLWIDLRFALEKPAENGDRAGLEQDIKLNQKIIKGGVYLASSIGYLGEESGWYRYALLDDFKLQKIANHLRTQNNIHASKTIASVGSQTAIQNSAGWEYRS